jgi:tRNA-splicing ligase RtcB
MQDDRAVRAALCADGHLGYAVPIGGVVAYRGAISPSRVGFDIACGNKVVLLDMPGTELRARIVQIMDDLWRTISFGVGRKNLERVDHPLFAESGHAGWDTDAAKTLKQKAQQQLGTVGSGNHYVDLLPTNRIGCGLVCTSVREVWDMESHPGS